MKFQTSIPFFIFLVILFLSFVCGQNILDDDVTEFESRDADKVKARK